MLVHFNFNYLQQRSQQTSGYFCKFILRNMFVMEAIGCLCTWAKIFYISVLLSNKLVFIAVDFWNHQANYNEILRKKIFLLKYPSACLLMSAFALTLCCSVPMLLFRFLFKSYFMFFCSFPVHFVDKCKNNISQSLILNSRVQRCSYQGRVKNGLLMR